MSVKAGNMPRLLVVDDNEDIHEDMRYILKVDTPEQEQEDGALAQLKAELFGRTTAPRKPEKHVVRYRIDDAWQGADAVKMVEAALLEGDPYAVVFLDVNMPPGQDGIRTAGSMWEKDPYLEIVICTAYADYSWEQIVDLYGETDRLLFVRKPFDSVSMKQIALSQSTKWRWGRQVRAQIEELEAEVSRRTVELESTVERLKSEMMLRRDKEFQLARLAHYDALTGLLNRHSFYGMVGEIAARPASVAGPDHALLFVDIDGFKQVNDQWGHDMGDRLLVEIASRIREAAGNEPTRLEEVISLMANTELETAIFRLGGDEFTLLLDFRGYERARIVAERILSALSRPFHLKGQELHIACSIGVSLLHGDAPDFGTLLRHADTAMYKAKERGNSVVFHDQLRGTGWLDPVELVADLEAAVDGKGMEVLYQRILDPEDRLTGMAALIRWRHPRFGMILPDDFLPLAERLGLMNALERNVLQTACRQLSSLSSREHQSLFVLVHGSLGLFGDPSLPAFVSQLLQQTGLTPDRLYLACDIRQLQDASRMVFENLNALTELGVCITLEGIHQPQPLQSVLSVLPAPSLSQVDGSLLVGIATRTGDRLYLQNLLDILQGRGIRVLVPGVETAAQDQFLKQRTCLRQGFLHGGPVPFDEFVRELGTLGTGRPGI